MKRYLIFFCIVFGCLNLPLPAAVITWSGARAITADSDVSTSGVLVKALAASGSAYPTVNGVTFTPAPGPDTLTGNNATNLPTGALPVGGALTSAYATLLSQNIANNTTGSILTLTLNNLTVGAHYELQIWFHDANATGQGTLLVKSPGTTDPWAKLDANPSDQLGGRGQFALGTFTADATTQVVTLQGSVNALLQAYQLRRITAPLATIAWEGWRESTGPAEVATTGTGTRAYTFGPVGTAPAAALNGVNFTAFSAQSTDTTTGLSAAPANTFASAAAPFSTLPADYRVLLGNGATGARSATLTLNQLQPGQWYLVQVWANDSRALAGGRKQRINGSLWLNSNPGLTSDNLAFEGGLGHWMQGSFQASAASQRLEFDADSAVQLNALQLRAIPAPDPYVHAFRWRRLWYLASWLDGRVPTAGGIIWSQTQAWFATGDFVTARTDAAAKGGATAMWTGSPSHFDIWPAADLVARRAKYVDALTRDRVLAALRRFGYLRSTSNFAELALSTRLLASAAFGEDSLLHPQNDMSTADPTGRDTFIGRANSKLLNGCGEYASSPYGWYNILPSLSVAQLSTDPVVRSRALLSFDACLAQLASVWMPEGYLLTFSGRSYPEGAYNGLGRMLWMWFGEAPATFSYQPQASIVAAMEYTPPAALLRAAGERDSIYTSRHSFDAIQTAYVYKDQYGIYSHEGPSGGRQQYQDGVRWKGMKNSYLWLTKPNDDDPALVRVAACHGTVSADVGTVQHKDAILMAFDMSYPKATPYPYALGHIPGIYTAMRNRTGANTPADGRPRVFVHYGTVMAVITADIPFTWDPNSGVYCKEMPTDPGDSEIRIAVGGVGNPVTNPTGFMSTIDAPNNRFAMAIETAHPEEFPGVDAAAQLAAFETAILAQTALRHDAPSPTVAYYTTRRGERLKVQAKVGAAYPVAAAINDVAVDYVNWPTNESPWVSQLRQNPSTVKPTSGGNVVLTAGRQRTVLDVVNWTRTDSLLPGSTTTPALTAAPATGLLPTSAVASAELTSTGSGPTSLTCYWGPTDVGPTASGWAQSLSLGNRAVGTTFATLTGLTPGASYVYRFAATNASGTSWSAPIAFQAAPVPPPGVPSGLRFTLTSGAIPLAWDAATDAVSYTVKRATTSGGPYTVRQSGLTSLSYTDTGLTPGTTYYYVVTAVNSGGESASSGQLTAAPATTPAVPAGVAAVTGFLYPRVSWTASLFATRYIVKRASASTGPYTTLATDVSGTFFDDTTAANLTTYFYTVAAANFAGTSADSAPGSVAFSLASSVIQTSGTWSTVPWYPTNPGRPASGNTTAVDFLNPDAALASQQNLGAFTLRQLRFLGRDVTLTGDPLTLGGTTPSLSVAATGTASLANSLTLAAATTLNLDGNLTLSGPLTGTGALTKSGPGTLRFVTNPAYSGNTTLDGGTVVFDAPAPSVKTLLLGASVNSPNPTRVEVNADVSVTGLTVQTTDVTNLLTIAAGRSFTITGSFLGGGLNTGSQDSHLTVSGPGAFVFNSPTSPFVVRRGSQIDLSAAGEVRITTPRLLIGDSDVRPSSLPATLTVSAHGLTRIQADAIHLDGVSVGGTTNAGESATFLAPAGSGRLVIRNTAGTGPATLAMNLRGGQSSVASYTTFDLRGHDSDLLLDTLDIAHRSVSYGGGPGAGAFFFDTGTLTVTGRTRLATSDLATVVNSANATIGGGTVSLLGGLDVATVTTGQRIAASFTLDDGDMTSGKITLATAAHGRATADLILNGGSLTLTDDITTGINLPAPDGSASSVTARVLLDGTTLDLAGHDLGTPAGPIALLSLQSGELRNIGSIASLDTAGTTVLTGLTKTDIATLRLSGLNTYTGPTSIQSGELALRAGSVTASSSLTVELLGTLSGTGTIASPVTIKGDFRPGDPADPAATLALTRTVTLASTAETFFSIDRALTLPAARVSGSTTLTYGGILRITNTGAALGDGDRFVLFGAQTYLGTFATLDLPPLAAGLAWDTRSLIIDGSLVVRAVAADGSIVTTKYWDTSATSGLQGGNGTWDISGASNWNTAADGTGPLARFWQADTALFQNGLTNTITLGGTIGVATLAQSGNGTATTLNGGTLRLSGPAALSNGVPTGNAPLSLNSAVVINGLPTTFTAAQPVTLSQGLSGTGALTKAGPSSLTVTGTNTWTGALILDGGTTRFNAATPGLSSVTYGAALASPAAATLQLTQNTTLTALTARNLASNTLDIPAGRTLTVNGPVILGFNGDGTVVSGTTALTFTGGGNLAVNSPGGNFIVAGGSKGGTATADLTALASATINTGATGNLYLGVNASITNDTLLLAPNTTLTANNLYVGDANTGGTYALTLGTGTNLLNLNNIFIGQRPGLNNRSDGSITAPASATGTLRLRAADGSSRANLILNDNISSTGRLLTTTFDVSGSPADLLLNQLIIGRRNATSSPAQVTADTFRWDRGTLDVLSPVVLEQAPPAAQKLHVGTMTLGSAASTPADTAIFRSGIVIAENRSTVTTAGASVTGTLNIAGGSITSAGITLGDLVTLTAPTTGTRQATATLNLTGGTLTLTAPLASGTSGGPGTKTATLTLDGGFLDLGGNALGGTGPAALTTLNVLSGTLANVASINGTSGFTKTTTGLLTLTGTHTFTGPITVSAGTLVLAPAVSATTSLSVANGSSLVPGGSITGNLTLPVGATFLVRLDSASSFDRLVLTGPASTATLGGTLDFIPATGLPPGTRFRLLRNQGNPAAPVTGTFAGRAHRTPFTASSRTWYLDYAAGSGGDVDLVLASDLELWRQTHFGTLFASANSADLADPDRDGLSNLLEYAFGTSPTSASSSAAPSVSLLPAPVSKLQLTFLRARPELTYTVEASSTLAPDSWSIIATNPGTVGPTNPISVSDTISLSSGAPRRFLRLRVTAP